MIPRERRFVFGAYDKVVLDGTEFRPREANDVGWIMADPASGLMRQVRHEDLEEAASRGRLACHRGYHHPDAARRRGSVEWASPASLPPESLARFLKRMAYVLAFLSEEAEGKVRRTDAAIAEHMGILAGKARDRRGSLACDHGVEVPESADLDARPSAHALRNWVVTYEKGGEMALVDRAHRRGNRTRNLAPAVQTVMEREIGRYLSLDRPTKKMIHESVLLAVKDMNAGREAAGAAVLPPPSRETVRRAIEGIDPFARCVARYGRDIARKKFKSVTGGTEYEWPLQRVELDGWTTNTLGVRSFLGLDHIFDEEDLQRFGIDPRKEERKMRWKIIVGLCCTTRCIVSLVVTKEETQAAVRRAYEMMMSDKGALASAAGATGSWSQGGIPGTVVTDGGSGFTGCDALLALSEMGITHMICPAGVPEARGTVERFNGTMARDLSPRLSGRTFADIAKKGDADPDKRAAHGPKTLFETAIRWTVDRYHNTPHRGLGGDTPLERWEAVTKRWGAPQPLDMGRRRTVFGERLTYRLDKTGISVLGVRYNSPALSENLRRSQDGPQKRDIRWHPDDIGAIRVRLGEEWHEVPSVRPGLENVGAQSWLSATRRSGTPSRAGRRALDLDAAIEAARAIENTDRDARRIAGAIGQDWSAEQIDREEKRLAASVTWHERGLEPAAASDGRPGRSIARAAGPAGAALPPDRPEDPPGRRGGPATEDY